MVEIVFRENRDLVFSNLKEMLIDRGCRVRIEDFPEKLVVVQGSLRGVMPLSAKKVIFFRFFLKEEKTMVMSKSDLDKVWVGLTVFGSLLAGFVAGLFFLLSNVFARFGDVGGFGFLSVLSLGLGIFLVFAIIFEVFDLAYVYPRRELLASKCLNELKLKLDGNLGFD